jgi:magnesium transporter
MSDMEAPEASMVLSAMDPDDAVDVLEHVEGPLHDEIVREMDAEDVEEVRQLEQYPPDTAGGIMTTEVTALYEYLTVGQAIEQLRALNEQLEQMFYVYVIDRRGHLIGVLSMRDLILARPERLLRDIMRPRVVSVPATMDQEQVARLMRRFNYLAMPVVDERNRLVGLVTVDDVVDVVEEEATEDVQKMFGAGAEERLTSPWVFSFRKRVGWLLVNLGTAFMAAAVVGLFSDTIQKWVVLAFYMPIIAGSGGNASAQAMAVAVRGLALGQVDRALLGRVLLRQLVVGVMMGVVIGIVTGVIAAIFHHDQGWALAFVVTLALVINHTLATVSGAAIPFIMNSLGFDPAQSATIFATTVTDVGGFFSLLGLASLFLH